MKSNYTICAFNNCMATYIYMALETPRKIDFRGFERRMLRNWYLKYSQCVFLN